MKAKIYIDVWHDITKDCNPTDYILVWKKGCVEVHHEHISEGYITVPIYGHGYKISKGQTKKEKIDFLNNIITDWNELDIDDMTVDEIQDKIHRYEFLYFSNKKRTKHGFLVLDLAWKE